jgi:hypothetical protein
MAYVCRKIELGRSGSIPEVMVKWEGFPTPIPCTYFRTSSIVAYAEICAPDDLLNKAWNNVVIRALTAAGAVATILAGPEAALPTFQAAFQPCLTAKLAGRAGEVKVALSTQQQPNEDWHR